MNQNEVKKHRWGKTVIVILLILAIIAGLAMLFSPYLENMDHRKQVKTEVTTFKELVSVYKTEPVPTEQEDEIEKPPVVYPELLAAMEDYNQEIYENGQSDLVDAWSYQADVFDLSDYGFELDAIGLVTIPEISVEMPLYLGGSYSNLSKGFAQLSQTSMPIGGKNTNCVIAGHRGWNGMAYMRDVEKLEIGDAVYLENPWETLEYRIDDIFIIQPNKIEKVLIQEGRDLLTVVTCHPYGVGSHRYVLICERVEPEAEEVEVTVPETTGKWVWEWQDRVSITTSEDVEFESSQLTIFVSVYLPWICLALALLILAVSLLIVCISKVR